MRRARCIRMHPGFDVGNNVIAGNQFFSGPEFRIADRDVCNFVVPENSGAVA
jgi:hypothetical protein